MAEEALKWIVDSRGFEPNPEYYCATRDIADGRLPRLVSAATSAGFSEERAPLLAALAGELTANCFDHNLGAWRDIPGCWFSFGASDSGLSVVVADRGQGILSSLRRADPSIATDEQALVVALTQQISGRQPEHRGRGLKFIVAALDREFPGSTFRLSSGTARFEGVFPMGSRGVTQCITNARPKLHGTFASLEINADVKQADAV